MARVAGGGAGGIVTALRPTIVQIITQLELGGAQEIALLFGSITWPASAAGEATSKIAAAIGLAHSTRVASTLQSQAGRAPVACPANRGSRRYASREPNSLIRVRPPGGAAKSARI